MTVRYRQINNFVIRTKVSETGKTFTIEYVKLGDDDFSCDVHRKTYRDKSEAMADLKKIVKIANRK